MSVLHYGKNTKGSGSHGTLAMFHTSVSFTSDPSATRSLAFRGRIRGRDRLEEKDHDEQTSASSEEGINKMPEPRHPAGSVSLARGVHEKPSCNWISTCSGACEREIGSERVMMKA